MAQEKTLPVAFIMAQVINEIAEVANALVKEYPVNDYSNRMKRADCLRRVRAAVELLPLEPKDGFPAL